MLQPARFIFRLTIRLELYTNFIVVPLVLYFGKLTGHYPPEAERVLNLSSAISALALLAAGILIRTIILSLILRGINKEGADIAPLKKKLLNYPRVEMIIISLRWCIGLISIFLAMYLLGHVEASRVSIYLIDILMSVTVNAVISFFATENMLSTILRKPRLAATPLPYGSYAPLSIQLRLLMTVVAVLIIPLVIMGLMIILISSQTITIDRLAGHIVFIVVMTIATLSVILIESTRGMRSGTKMIIEALKTLEGGDFNIGEIPMLDRSEIGIISQFINILSFSLRNFTRKSVVLNKQLVSMTEAFTMNADSLSRHVREQATSVEQIMATTEEISSGAESAMRTVEEQYDAMESLIASMSDLTEVMDGVTSRIGSVIRLSGDIENTAQRSGTTLNAMVESLKIVSESSAQMTGIIEIINDISDKINLLSLNASIEAARAGDAGRGFAVVADEVSKLADMTANSIKDISSLVQGNIDEIRTGMKRIDDTVSTISTITGHVNSTNSQTNDISKMMVSQHEINEKVNREAGFIRGKSDLVRTVMKEQKTALIEIVKSIAVINEATQSTASSAEVLFGKAKELDVMAAELLKD